MDRQIAEKLVENICRDLKIKKPTIKYGNFPLQVSKTALAYYDGDNIFIRDNIQEELDVYFSICHELRHIWQMRTNQKYYFGNYKTSNELDIVTYNLQIAEVDANAYAYNVMRLVFGVSPLFNGMTEEVIQAIKDRALGILRTNQF